MYQQLHTPTLMPSFSGLLLVLLSTPLTILLKVAGTDVAVGLSILVSGLATVDYVFKIHWKMKQRAAAKRAKKEA